MTTEMLQESTVDTSDPTQNLPDDSAQASQEVAQPEEAQAQERTETDADRVAKEAAAKQRRIDRLTRDRYSLRAERDHFAAEVERLRQQTAPAAQGQDEHQRTITDEDIDALAESRAAEKLSAVQFNSKCEAVHQQGEKAFKGEWKEALQTVNDIAPLFDSKARPQPLMQAILDTDAPHKLLHHLGQNPDLAEELADMNPRQQVRRLAKLEIELEAKPQKQISSAAKPLTPVKPGATSDEPDARANPEAWIKWRNKQSRS